MRQQLRPSHVHSYGFKPTCRTSHITALVRQLQYLSARWDLPLIVALQDVKTAFDAMHHEHIAESMSQRGVSAGVTAAHLRELTGLHAFITLPGVGDTQKFCYSRGGKQGGLETPDQWNALVDHMLEPVVVSWTMRKFGFALDEH